MKGKIIIIGALTTNNAVGKDNKLLWEKPQLPRDMPNFIYQTKRDGPNALISGRKTFESFGNKPLSGRKSIVVSRTLSPGEQENGSIVFSSIEDAVDYAVANFKNVFLIGGTEIWRYGLEVADYSMLTRVQKEIEGDTFFPIEGLVEPWNLIFEESWAEKEEGKLSSLFQLWERR